MGTVTVTFFDHHKILLNEKSLEFRGAFLENGTLREPDEVKFIHKELLKIENPILLDIGANTGSYCLIPSVNKTLRCYAFEPSPIVFPILTDNVKLNNLDVNIYNLALSDSIGLLKLKIPKHNPGSGGATLGNNPLRFSEYFELDVSVTTLDSWMEQEDIGKIDIIKIDTEGCEKFVLNGGVKTIKKYRPAILIEVNTTNTQAFGYDASEFLELLGSWGYLVKRSFGENLYLEYGGPMAEASRYLSSFLRRTFPSLHSLLEKIIRKDSKPI